ncbi:hypothetical protein SBD_1539 [Streptomyces bottropensis ATCC 25435]|uniref:Uncharacterized protein n=1 Tax=Streptomyces bottropensis ATCC 25435 TaxID=1054862 RepID=M3F5W3_9ACTN|nr:hypothetical protein SBD_1539 [Streptomyces bottropensis ATCC 25435]
MLAFLVGLVPFVVGAGFSCFGVALAGCGAAGGRRLGVRAGLRLKDQAWLGMDADGG